MTPKEKAKELAIKFTGRNDFLKPTIKSKILSLICVDIIYNLNLKIGSYGLDYENQEDYFEYWEEVEQEIKKL